MNCAAFSPVHACQGCRHVVNERCARNEPEFGSLCAHYVPHQRNLARNRWEWEPDANWIDPILTPSWPRNPV